LGFINYLQETSQGVQGVMRCCPLGSVPVEGGGFWRRKVRSTSDAITSRVRPFVHNN